MSNMEKGSVINFEDLILKEGIERKGGINPPPYRPKPDSPPPAQRSIKRKETVMKEMFVICWRYYDNSGFGLHKAFETKEEAEEYMDDIKGVADSEKELFIREVKVQTSRGDTLYYPPGVR